MSTTATIRPMETIKFKGDSATRRRFFTPESFQHPAKGHLGLWAELIQMYTKPGDLVLDPMAGIGTTLVAALMGRNVICVELEPHFVEPMCRSWEKMRTMPMLGCEMGQVVILRGDARCLPLPDASMGAAITSPPYEEQNFRNVGDEPYGSQRYGGMARQIKNTNRYTREGKMSAQPVLANAERAGYTRPVDAIVTSPSFEKQDTSAHPGVLEPMLHTMGRANRNGTGHDSAENIGNLKGSQYFEAMKLCYDECWRVLKLGGIMALVLKGFTRDGQYVDLPGQTESLLLEAGWQKHDHWRRELYSLSFWRILQRRRSPEAFDNRLWYEEVLAFRKLT